VSVSSIVLLPDGPQNADARSIWPPQGEWDGESLDDIDRAIYTSLYSDKRVKQSELPPGEHDRRGWWGDTPALVEVPGDTWGSRLWLAQRAKLTDDPKVDGVRLVQLQRWAADALQWMIDDGMVAALEVIAERLSSTRAALQITTQRSRTDQPRSYYYDAVWEEYRV
jgi:phage gp46-like protein